MNKMLNIWISLCLFGLLGNVISGANQTFSSVENVELNSVADSDNITGSVLFSTPHPYLFLAENVQKIFKEVEPKSSAKPVWTSLRKEFSTGAFYIQRSLSFTLSQSVSNMIFPFHSYL